MVSSARSNHCLLPDFRYLSCPHGGIQDKANHDSRLSLLSLICPWRVRVEYILAYLHWSCPCPQAVHTYTTKQDQKNYPVHRSSWISPGVSVSIDMIDFASRVICKLITAGHCLFTVCAMVACHTQSTGSEHSMAWVSSSFHKEAWASTDAVVIDLSEWLPQMSSI